MIPLRSLRSKPRSIHRIGPALPVNYLRLIAADTIDELITNTLERKSANLIEVRTVRPLDKTEGLKLPGAVYGRTQEDAEYLSVLGLFEIVRVTANNRTGKATKLKVVSPS